jgi:hypothetical protein
MNNKICANCNLPNMPEMQFCTNCGGNLPQISADEPAPTMMAGDFAALQQSGQNFQAPNFQTPNFQQQNYQQSNFQQPNFQPSNFQPAPASGGGQMKKILLGAGGLLIGLVMLASGGVKLYRAFGGSGDRKTITNSSTPQDFYANSRNTSSNTNSGSISNLRSAPTPPSRTIDDFTQRSVGDWNLRDTLPGNPERDGFSGTREEKQYKYFNASQAMIHLTVADYPSEAAAKDALRTSMQKFRNLNLRVGPEVARGETGIMQIMASVDGKIFTRYWTNNNYLYRALGTSADVENFYNNSKY